MMMLLLSGQLFDRDHMHKIQGEVDVMKTDQSCSKIRCVPLSTLQGKTDNYQ